MTRLAFVLQDLETEIRSIAPTVGEIEIRLGGGSFTPVADELGNHFGQPLRLEGDNPVVRLGAIALRRA